MRRERSGKTVLEAGKGEAEEEAADYGEEEEEEAEKEDKGHD